MSNTSSLRPILISAVFNRPAIWDHQHSDHRNRYKLVALWKEVAAICETTPKAIKSKWKGLREQFKSKLEQLPPPSPSNPTPEDLVQWPYFKPMLFMRDCFEDLSMFVKHETDAVSDEDDLDSSEVAAASSPPPSRDVTSTATPRCPPSKCTVSSSATLIRVRVSDSNDGGSRPVVDAKVVEEGKQQVAMRGLKRSLDEEDDEDVAFFTSLLPHVRRMTPVDKMAFRIDVQKLAMERAYGVSHVSYQ